MFGLPAQIHSDQRLDFESKLLRGVLTITGIQKSRNMPYHSQGDPQPDHFNCTHLNMLGTLQQEQKASWSQHIVDLVHAYTFTWNNVMGVSP